MTEPTSIRGDRAPPLGVVNASDFEGKSVPIRDWLVPGVLVRRSLTLFAGDGGTGKSLMCLQLQVAAALGLDWLGLQVPGPMNSFAFYCEDDIDEIHRRLHDILAHHRRKFTDLQGRLRFVSRVGEENELVVFKGFKDSAKAEKTPLFRQVEEEVRDWGAQLIIIDTAADAFAGNENIRPQVRAFVNLVRRLALIHDGGVVLNSHPSKSAMADGSGFSGSTAWNGSVRNRLFLTHPKAKHGADEEDGGPTTERILKVMKSNYGPFGDEIKCNWEKGVFVEQSAPRAAGQFEKLDCKRRVLDAAVWLVQRGAFLAADAHTRTSLVTRVKQVESCKEFSFGEIKNASEALLADGKLVMIEMGPKSKRRVYVRPSFCKYPGEQPEPGPGLL